MKKKSTTVLCTCYKDFQFFNKIVTLPFQSHTHPCVPTISRNERKEEWASEDVSAVKALASHQHVPAFKSQTDHQMWRACYMTGVNTYDSALNSKVLKLNCSISDRRLDASCMKRHCVFIFSLTLRAKVIQFFKKLHHQSIINITH